jgi:hypothetical protein
MFHPFLDRLTDRLLHALRRLARINYFDTFGSPFGFGEKASADAVVILQGSAFDAIARTGAPHTGLFERQIENEGQIRFDAAGGQTADLPQLVHVEAARVTLIDDIGEQVTVGNDYVSSVESGPDDLGDELSTAGHKQKRFASRRHIVAMVQNDVPQHATQDVRAGIDAASDGVAAVAQPVRKQAALRRFAAAVETIQREEVVVCHEEGSPFVDGDGEQPSPPWLTVSLCRFCRGMPFGDGGSSPFAPFGDGDGKPSPGVFSLTVRTTDAVHHAISIHLTTRARFGGEQFRTAVRAFLTLDRQ